jgi:4-diphosphocytidyl-2-C-methyl-D-erythritol kinase
MNAVKQKVRAPAKVNLHLRIVGRRADGYHLLESLLAPIDLCDELLISLGPDTRSSRPVATIAVSTDSEAVPNGPANLAYRAAAIFQATVKRSLTVNIRINKRIPVGSGLGGGSSDAAAVLLALNRLFGSPLQTEELARLGAGIGADVPFFVHGRPAQVGGVGDRIMPVGLPSPLSLVVCSDRYVLSTAMVYSHVDLSLTTARPASNITAFISGRKPLADLLVNDLEAAAAQVHPQVLSLKAKLVEQGAMGALMTGSGAAVFGVWSDPQLARNAAVRLRQEGLWAEAAQTLDVSPAVGSG